MTPERWAQIEALYRAALECSPEEYTRLLSGLSTDLRGELESLLAQNGTKFDHPAADLLATEPSVQIGIG